MAGIGRCLNLLENKYMDTQQISACRLELPKFYFVDVYNIPRIRRQQILSSFTAGDLHNKATAKSITEALEKAALTK